MTATPEPPRLETVLCWIGLILSLVAIYVNVDGLAQYLAS